MDDKELLCLIFMTLQEIITNCVMFLNAMVAAHKRLKQLRNPRIRTRIVRYNMADRIPGQISHLRRIVDIGDVECINNLRMSRNAFARLCYLTEHVGGLTDCRYVSVQEKVAMFLAILAHHKKNRIVGHDYLRSGKTVSKNFHDVLSSILKLHHILLVEPTPVPADSTNERWKNFKGCLGALDGTHISVHIGENEKAGYRTRKGITSVNVLVVCDHDMKFVYVLPGWEGSAADSRVLRDALCRPNGLKVPKGMEDSQIYCEEMKGKKNEKGRRIWSTKEEEALLSALKDLVNKGWKSENGFRNGYLIALEDSMKNSFPGTDIRGMPYINSKIHVWKKNYGSLFTILSTSGIGWNDTDKMIDAPDNDWAALVKIFGKDRATGHNDEGFVDAIHDVLNQTQTSNENDVDIGLEDIPCSEIEDYVNSKSTRKMTGDSSNKKTSKKRKSMDDSGNLNEVMKQFSEKTDARLAEITKCLVNAFDITEATNDVFQVLDCFEWLTIEAKVFVAKKLVNNPQELKLFFKLPDDAKAIFIKMLLS